MMRNWLKATHLNAVYSALLYFFVGCHPYKNQKEKFDALTIFLLIGGIITFISFIVRLARW